MGFPRPAPVRLSAQELAQTRKADIYVAVSLTMVIAISGVALRFVSRQLSHTKLSYDDGLILVALVSLIIRSIATLLIKDPSGGCCGSLCNCAA